MSDPAVDDTADKYMVPALERGLRILGEFSRESRTLSAPELARRLDLPRSTVFRLLNTLETLGFIQRIENGNDYRLGLAVLRLGFEFLSSLELTELGQPILARLCGVSGYPSNLVVRDGRSIVYVAKVTPPTPLTSSVRVGTRLPAHATVLGRVLLGDLSLAELRTLYPEEHLEAFSERTPATTLALFDLVEQDRQRGYVYGLGFFESGISTLAAPVYDASGRVVAALGVTMAAVAPEPAAVEVLAQQVCEAAAELSRLLNYQPRTATPAKVVALRS